MLALLAALAGGAAACARRGTRPALLGWDPCHVAPCLLQATDPDAIGPEGRVQGECCSHALLEAQAGSAMGTAYVCASTPQIFNSFPAIRPDARSIVVVMGRISHGGTCWVTRGVLAVGP